MSITIVKGLAMPQDPTNRKFGPFTTLLPAQAHSLIQTYAALRQTTQLYCPISDRFNAYVDCYRVLDCCGLSSFFRLYASLHQFFHSRNREDYPRWR